MFTSKAAAGGFILSATDITEYLACTHLTQQRRAIAVGERGRPRPVDDPHAELIRERGDEHERAQLEVLVAEAGGDWVDLAAGAAPARTVPDLTAAAERTTAAMRAGTRLLFQATLFDGDWQGRADFLRRRDTPSDLGAWSYEVLDTKLTRRVRPSAVHQLCLYSRLVGRVQGRPPERAHLVLGDGTRVAIDPARYAALHRHVARRLGDTLRAGPVATYPEPVGHCDMCALAAECDARRRADDHLSLVAGATRIHRSRLTEAGVDTLAALAERSEADAVPGLAAERFSLLRHQAGLQRNTREGRDPVRRHLEPVAERGYARLPAPDPGDIYFDLEGDPYVDSEGGIEFLWGWCDAAGHYHHVWSHDRAGERESLRHFIDTMQEARARHPQMHVFHYAPHEAAALRRLAMLHAVGEETVDDWLRRGVLVDLYAVVRQGLQVGEESYSLKRLERHHGYVRHETTVRAGGGAIATYERWRETGEAALLDAIRDYNREDCESTRSLRHWLHRSMLPEAEERFGIAFADLRPDEVAETPPPAWLPDVLALIERLHDGLPDDPADDDAAGAERRLLGHLLLHHHRENKPQWWRYFELRGMTAQDLVDEREAVGLLALDESVPPVPYKRSLDYTYRFPPQEAKLATGQVVDPLTGDGFNLIEIDADRLVLRRGKAADPPRPSALIAGGPPDPKALRDSLMAVAGAVLDGGAGHEAVRRLLRREPPRLASGKLGAAMPDLVGATLGLDGSYLPVQGPPGTGKTYSGARMVVAALAAGRRVAITANSHAAIQNLLHAVEEHAAEAGHPFAGSYKGDGYESGHGSIEAMADNAAALDRRFGLVAGTAWLLSRSGPADFDLLFVDEAGQLALAAAVAAGRCAENIVLLGDPQQLPQVNQADHPEGSGASVLEHVLAGADVVDPARGVLLDVSWRMHPDVCRFVSERSYGGRLRSRDECAARRVDAHGPLTGSGLRVMPVEHAGREQDSPEEAAAIAAACRNLLAPGATVTEADGNTRPLTAADILVVAPFNMAVARIRSHVPAGVRVGTVDRFQGQEAPVVFFAMTCSSGQDVPRGLDFLFDRNRLNVAVSRAQCLAVLVHSPRLLDAECPTTEQMALVDGACRFVELAQPVGG